jgi:aldehyde:ferredoxin oxidoreductase
MGDMPMFGFKGKILVVDLDRKNFKILEKHEPYLRKYMGGALLGAALYEELIAGRDPVDPLGPENPIIFATGPMAGANVCGATRVNVLSMAPESTGIYLSQAGGEFGPAIKRAGFDALVITGQSDIPIVLDINNDKVGFVDAGDLWGKDRVDARNQIIENMGNDYCIASIGPAGEHQVRYANIMFEPDHYAGRGGLGAVLGAKLVKAVAIRGDQKILFKNPETVKAINGKGGKDFAESIKKNPRSFLGVLRHLGTYGLLEMNRKSGNLPTRNFNFGCPKDAADLKHYTHATAKEEIVGRISPCKNCFVACKKSSKIHPGHSSLAEYESIAILGPNIGLEEDLETCLEACELCNRLGLDTISTGNMIAWMMNCFENNVIDEDTLGYSIDFGDGEKVIALIKNIAFRENDLGNLLADGIAKAEARFGAQTEPYSRFVNGVGMPAHMPRKKPGIGFAYLHGPNPNDHMKQEHDWIASDPGSLKPFNLTVLSAPDALDAAKIDVTKATQTYYAAMDSLSLCMFIFGPGNIYVFDEIISMVNAATGFDLGFGELMEIGERTIQLQRKLYLHLGGKDSELLPFMEQEIPEGPSKGARINKGDFDRARKYYYDVMGWDEKGWPKEETLKRLGI